MTTLTKQPPAGRLTSADLTSPPRKVTAEVPARLERRRNSWYARQRAHTEAATKLGSISAWLGLTTVVLSTIVGTSVITALTADTAATPRWARVLIGVLSVAAAVAAALKEKLKLDKRVEKHAAARASFEELRYGAEQLLDRASESVPPTITELENALSALEKKAVDADKKAQTLNDRLYRSAVEWVREEDAGTPHKAVFPPRLWWLRAGATKK